MELQETPWSKCYGSVVDKFNIEWQFSHEAQKIVLPSERLHSVHLPAVTFSSFLEYRPLILLRTDQPQMISKPPLHMFEITSLHMF
jgi:hypothetical protein